MAGMLIRVVAGARAAIYSLSRARYFIDGPNVRVAGGREPTDLSR